MEKQKEQKMTRGVVKSDGEEDRQGQSLSRSEGRQEANHGVRGDSVDSLVARFFCKSSIPP